MLTFGVCIGPNQLGDVHYALLLNEGAVSRCLVYCILQYYVELIIMM
jgi:hypothetical protein